MTQRYLLSPEAAGLVRSQLLARGAATFRPRARDFTASAGGGGGLVPAVVTGNSLVAPWTWYVDVYGAGLGAPATESGVEVVVLPLGRNSDIPIGTLILVSRSPLVSAEMGAVI